jgi:hypothetical protein
MSFKLAASIILFIGQQVLCVEAANNGALDATVGQPFVDESGWAIEPVPAEQDAEIARLLKIYDVPEPWDHY